jgi:hypothetical protein
MTRYCIKRSSDGQFWGTNGLWTYDERAARRYRSRKDAITSFVLDYHGTPATVTAEKVARREGSTKGAA